MVRSQKKRLTKNLPPSIGGRVGCVACLAAAAMALMDLRLAAVPLGGFMVLCAVAPFIPSSSFFLPVISRGTSSRRAVALTFDDGPDPLTTPELLRLLKRHRVRGTFFVTGSRVLRYPEIARDIVAQGHSLGNHSFNHDMWGAFRSTKTMTQEIQATQQALKGLGIVALAYRPPMGITSPRLRGVMPKEGMFVVNFSCRAWDGGNRRIRNLSQRILQRVRANDILLLHENLTRPSLLPSWAKEVDRILGGIREKGLEVLPLAELIGRPVMAAAVVRDGIRRSVNSDLPGPAAPDVHDLRPPDPDEG
jgi:peptidoglycan/xylan/chitin deacetylase (PgdA/CDA1 family)